MQEICRRGFQVKNKCPELGNLRVLIGKMKAFNFVNVLWKGFCEELIRSCTSNDLYIVLLQQEINNDFTSGCVAHPFAGHTI